MAVAAAGLHATTVLQQRQQVLLTAWLDGLLVTVQQELVERDEPWHLLRERQWSGRTSNGWLCRRSIY